MLSRYALVCLVALLSAGGARAATIVQTLLINGGMSDGSFSPSGYGFNPSLGPLASVTAVLQGSGINTVHIPEPGSPPSLALENVVKADLDGIESGPLGSAIFFSSPSLDPAVLTFGVKYSATLNPAAFISNDPSLISDLIFGSVSVLPAPGAGWGASHGSYVFNGHVTLTYTYGVPEPSALALLGAGLIGMTLVRRGRVAARRRESVMP